MAVISGSFTTSGSTQSGVTRNLVFSWSSSSSGNRTTISWTVKGGGTVGGSNEKWQYLNSITVVVNGVTRYSSSSSIQLHYNDLVASGSFYIDHTSEVTLSASVSAAIYSGSTNCTGSGTWTLPALLSASSLTVSQGPFTFGSSKPTFTITKTTSGLVSHALFWSLASGGSKYLISKFNNTAGASGSSTTYNSWTLSKELSSYFTFVNNQSSIKFWLYTYKDTTYSGSSIIGYVSSSDFTVRPSTDMLPQISSTITDATGYYDSYGKFYNTGTSSTSSQGSFTFTPTFYGSNTLSSQTLTKNGTASPNNTVSYSLDDKSNNQTKVIYSVVDNLGLTSSKTETITWSTDSPITINKLEIFRSNDLGDPDDQGNKAAVLYNGSDDDVTISAGTGNTKTEHATANQDCIVVVPNDISTSANTTVTVSVGSSYSTSAVLPPTFVTFELTADGTGFGFGQGAESKKFIINNMTNGIELNNDVKLGGYATLPNNITLRGTKVNSSDTVNLIGLDASNNISIGYNNPGNLTFYTNNHANAFTFGTDGSVSGITSIFNTYQRSRTSFLNGATFTAAKDGVVTVVYRHNGGTSNATAGITTSEASEESNPINQYVALTTQSTTSGYFSVCFPIKKGLTYTSTVTNATVQTAHINYFK